MREVSLRRAGAVIAVGPRPLQMFGTLPSFTRPSSPRQSERRYVGRRPGSTEVYVVSRTAVEPLPHLGYRSTAAFDWGRSTPGALELSFSLLAHATEHQPTTLVCRAFCDEIVACLEHAGFVLCDGNIALWLMSALPLAEGSGHDPAHEHDASQRWRALNWLWSRLRGP